MDDGKVEKAKPTTLPATHLPNPTLKRISSPFSGFLRSFCLKDQDFVLQILLFLFFSDDVFSQLPNTQRAFLVIISGIMDARVGLLVLIVLGANWACDARQLAKRYISDGEIQASKEFTGNPNVCTLCEEFAAQAIDYLNENKTQTEILETLHHACSQLHSLKQQCTTLVDYYAPLFFLEVSTVQPGEFCQKVNLCQQISMFFAQLHEDSCELCHYAVSEVLVKLKDPDTQLEIIEILLKACNSVENYVKQCKRMVFQYGPLLLANAEKFLETSDICIRLHACDSSRAGNSDVPLMTIPELSDF